MIPKDVADDGVDLRLDARIVGRRGGRSLVNLLDRKPVERGDGAVGQHDLAGFEIAVGLLVFQ